MDSAAGIEARECDIGVTDCRRLAIRSLGVSLTRESNGLVACCGFCIWRSGRVDMDDIIRLCIPAHV